MNTPIQEAIERINVKIKHFEGKDDLDLTLRERGMQDAYINSIRILESLVEKEKQIFLDFGDECQSTDNYDSHLPEEIFNWTFKKDNDAEIK